MTVSELRAILAAFPGDAPVAADDGDILEVKLDEWQRWPALSVYGYTRSRVYHGPPQPMCAVSLFTR